MTDGSNNGKELVVVVDASDNVIGTEHRNFAHKNGMPHRISVIYLRNTLGKILFQERLSGEIDHSAAGHVNPGESYLEAAYRELHEELYLSKITLQKIGHSVVRKMRDGDNIFHVFDMFEGVVEEDKVDFNLDEVKNIFWSYPNTILSDIEVSPGKYTEHIKHTLPLYLTIVNNKKSHEGNWS